MWTSSSDILSHISSFTSSDQAFYAGCQDVDVNCAQQRMEVSAVVLSTLMLLSKVHAVLHLCLGGIHGARAWVHLQLLLVCSVRLRTVPWASHGATLVNTAIDSVLAGQHSNCKECATVDSQQRLPKAEACAWWARRCWLVFSQPGSFFRPNTIRTQCYLARCP